MSTVKFFATHLNGDQPHGVCFTSPREVEFARDAVAYVVALTDAEDSPCQVGLRDGTTFQITDPAEVVAFAVFHA